MKSSKPIALMLFGLTLVLCTPGYIARDPFFDMIAFPIMCIGVLISFIGLIWAFKEK